MKNVFTPADILLPEKGKFENWSVIACDQFSSEREYWDRVGERVKNEPSTLHMVVPEAYLKGISMEEASVERNAAMDRYLADGIFTTYADSYVYVEREITGGGLRRGLVGKLDLEAYDYVPGSELPARASEKTVIERLPPRIHVRRAASLEMPHVLVLIDDEERSVVEPLTLKKDAFEKIYDFELMEGGGRLCGWQICGEEAEKVTRAVDALGKRAVQFVIGDGNHSLAAAKDCWRALRDTLTPEERENHPARFALVELCNVYDDGIVFEPIHRIVFDGNGKEILETLQKEAGDPSGRELRYLMGEEEGSLFLKNESLGSWIAAVQKVLDEAEAAGAEVDYIHDEAALRKLAQREGSLALFMPLMEKGDLFCTVERSGVFPKKSFSIGHARDKRYYTECRKIVK